MGQRRHAVCGPMHRGKDREAAAPPAVAAVQFVIAPHVDTRGFQATGQGLDNILVEAVVTDEEAHRGVSLCGTSLRAACNNAAYPKGGRSGRPPASSGEAPVRSVGLSPPFAVEDRLHISSRWVLR